MTEAPGSTGANLRLARQTRGFSQQQLASMAGVTRQAVSAGESGHSAPSLRVALALAQALGLSVEELFGPGEPAAPVTALPLAPLAGREERGALAPGGGRPAPPPQPALPARGRPRRPLACRRRRRLSCRRRPRPGSGRRRAAPGHGRGVG